MKKTPVITPNNIDMNNADTILESVIISFGMGEEQDNATLVILAAVRYGIDAIRELREIKSKDKG